MAALTLFRRQVFFILRRSRSPCRLDRPAVSTHLPLATPLPVHLYAPLKIILVPAVGTVPGFTLDELVDIVRTVHARGGLVMTTIGTSQETSDPATIRRIAHDNKIAGADIQHIGDAGPGGLADPMNIYTLSETIRGRRHTISRMARSTRR